MQLLLIEDHPDLATVLIAGLSKSYSDYVVNHCATLSDGLKKIASGDIDVVLLDLGLPDASGPDAAIAIRAAAPHLPIVVLSGEQFEQLAENLILHGVQDYIQKGTVSFERIDQAIRLAHKRQQQEEQLKRLVCYDDLTGLLNRSELHKRLAGTLKNAERSGTRAAILAIDLDDFKSINDSHGHGAGDAVLRAASATLSRLIRTSDCAARIGGDEFIVLLEPLDSTDNAVSAGNKLCRGLTQNVEVENHTVALSASVGIAVFPDHGSNGDTLLAFADKALYDAKRNGKSTACMYTPS